MSDFVKALTGGEHDEWVLDVLGVPYGGPNNGKDSDGEYFSPQTKLHEDKYTLPPIVYYHGLTPDGKPAGAPEYIGKAVSYEDRGEGRWYRVVLDKANAVAKRVWEAAQNGLARASSGSIAHLVRVARDGHIMEWPVGELSVFDVGEGRQPANQYAVALPTLKAVYLQAGLTLPEMESSGETEPEAAPPEALEGAAKAAETGGADVTEQDVMEESTMTEQVDIQAQVANAVAEALKAERDAQQKAAEEEAARKAAIADAVKAEREKWEAENAKSARLPGGAPFVAKHSDVWKYDNLDAGDQAVLVGILGEAQKSRLSRDGASEAAIKALGIKLEEDAEQDGAVGVVGMKALKAAGFAGKANELNYSTYSTYGDDAVGVAYSQALWEKIRKDAWVASQIPSIEVPQGHESITIPLEGADPTFYKMAQATGLASSTDHAPAATVTSSKVGTSSQSLTLAKMGARTLWSGEMEEDSLIPWVAQMRAQMARAGADTFNAVLIDGDTETGATTNINDIGGTPGGSEYFMLLNGFRKLALVTNTANKRDGGVLTVEDFLETLKLLGNSGKNADPSKVGFIVDPNVGWKLLELDEVKTRDTFSRPTIENGQLASIWGYNVRTSWNMHKSSEANTGYVYKTNTAGKVDIDTASNNTKGVILAVRWDQWLLGYRRRMVIETTRFPESDTNQIVAQMRFGMTYRDTEASAITYNLTV